MNERESECLRSIGGKILKAKGQYFVKKGFPVPLCPPEIPQGI